MAGNENRRKVKGTTAALDTMHIVIGIAIVVMTALSFVHPEEYEFCFPVVFLLAAILNLATGKFKMRQGKKEGKGKIFAACQMFLGVLFLILALVSTVSILWR